MAFVEDEDEPCDSLVALLQLAQTAVEADSTMAAAAGESEASFAKPQSVFDAPTKQPTRHLEDCPILESPDGARGKRVRHRNQRNALGRHEISPHHRTHTSGGPKVHRSVVALLLPLDLVSDVVFCSVR